MAENILRRPLRENRAPVREVTIPEAPGHLSDEAKSQWREIVETWELSGPDLVILRGGLEAWDLAQRCRREVERTGPTFTTESGAIRQNPAAKGQLDALHSHRMALRALGLDPPAPPPAGRRR